MTLDADSFLALCKELRQLGACKVEGYGFSAVFTPPVAGQPQGIVTAPAKPAKAPRGRKDEPSAEQLREAAYKRELGL